MSVQTGESWVCIYNKQRLSCGHLSVRYKKQQQIEIKTLDRLLSRIKSSFQQCSEFQHVSTVWLRSRLLQTLSTAKVK